MNTSTNTRGVALVTGGRRGIGAAIAGALADAGFDVAVSGITADEAGKAGEGGAASMAWSTMPASVHRSAAICSTWRRKRLTK